MRSSFTFFNTGLYSLILCCNSEITVETIYHLQIIINEDEIPLKTTYLIINVKLYDIFVDIKCIQHLNHILN